jgi:hypothetical protein
VIALGLEIEEAQSVSANKQLVTMLKVNFGHDAWKLEYNQFYY